MPLTIDPPGRTGEIQVFVDPPGGALSPAAPIELVEAHAWDKGNLAKLTSAEVHERHLAIWVDRSSPASSAMAPADPLYERPLPNAAPRLPDSIDRVWLISAFIPMRVWSYDRVAGWLDHHWWFPSGSA